MKLSVSHNFAFLCNPKCGSTSIERAISKYCRVSLGGHPTLKHINAKTYHRHVVPLLRKAGIAGKIETFCIIREPVERIFSWYRYQMRPQLRDPSHKAHAKYTGDMTFEEFVLGYISGKKTARSRKIGRQSDFMTLSDRSVGVDKIFRLDDMAGVENYLSTKIGKPIKIPHANISPVLKAGETMRKKGLLSSIFGSSPRPSTPIPAGSGPRDLKSKMEISSELLGRLNEHLAEDYRIYRDFTNH